jgi:peptide deformylase
MEIVKYPDPILEKKAKKVKNPLDPETQELIKQMLTTLEKAEGAGLAAPQVGKSLRICVIQCDGDSFVLINPKITSYSRDKEICEEGCLSFPGNWLPVKRSGKVKVRYADETGKEIKTKAEGLLARIIQHEVDHLDGILFVERAVKAKKKKK